MTATAVRDDVIDGTEMLSAEHQELARTVRRFADEVVAPASYEYDTARRLPMEIIAQMGEMGLFGLPIPTEYGGQGKDYMSLCVAVEQLGGPDRLGGEPLVLGELADQR